MGGDGNCAMSLPSPGKEGRKGCTSGKGRSMGEVDEEEDIRPLQRMPSESGVQTLGQSAIQQEHVPSALQMRAS